LVGQNHLIVGLIRIVSDGIKGSGQTRKASRLAREIGAIFGA
jgi:hypothetical protein